MYIVESPCASDGVKNQWVWGRKVGICVWEGSVLQAES